ncbi:hypothetical protein MFLAVUS_003012 [Mucor flavus]|uniref:Uncharacterized protein n=1 Tax=Mucor flavus TaxID=439312 RepID=A0ABP9YRX9_9FUNG
MTPIGKWFNRPRRNSSPTRALTEYMNISSSQQRNNTFPPAVPQRAPMLITSSFYNQEYPFETYDSSAAEEEELAATREPITPVVEPTLMYNQQVFVQEPPLYTSTQQNINIPLPRHHHDETYYTREPYRATNERAPTPFTSSERYADITEDRTFSVKDLADFEKLQNDFKKLEKKHKKKEKKIQELEYLLYSKNMETQPVPVPKPNHGYRSLDSSRPPVTPNHQYTRSFDIPRNNKPTSAPKLTSSYQSYYEPYYGYYYTNHTPSSYYYPSGSLETSSRHTTSLSAQHNRYNSFDNGSEENDDAMQRDYYLRYYRGRRPTT